jgi:hypothetical protein
VAFSVQRLKNAIELFTTQDDGKIEGTELTALLSISRGSRGELATDAIPEFVSLYRRGEDAFDARRTRTWLRDEMLGVGVAPVLLEIPDNTPELEAFYRLPVEDRMGRLFTSYDAATNHLTLAPGFSTTGLRFDTALTGSAQFNAREEYFRLRDEAQAAGGAYPAVRAIVKDGVAYAYVMATSVFGQWEKTRIYDRTFSLMKEYRLDGPAAGEPGNEFPGELPPEPPSTTEPAPATETSEA